MTAAKGSARKKPADEAARGAAKAARSPKASAAVATIAGANGSAGSPTTDRDESDGQAGLVAQLTLLLASCSTLQRSRQCVREAEALAHQAPDDVAVRFLLIQLRERAALHAGLLQQWAELLRDCPDDLQIVRGYARSLVKERRFDEAVALVDRHAPERMDDPPAALARAELLQAINAVEAGDALFKRLIARYDQRNTRVAFAKWLAKRGMVADAAQVLEPVVSTLAAGSKGAELATKVTDEHAFYLCFEDAPGLVGQDIKIVPMKQAILRFRGRAMAPPVPGKKTSIALVTGSLGPGGAERQLARLAAHLQRLSGAGDEYAGAGTGFAATPVEVLVKQHDSAPQESPSKRLDFFLADLLNAGVKVSEINALPPVSASHQPIEDADLLRMLGNLPPQVHYGATRLAPYLRERAFDVVSLWQDGTCLFGGLAALLAGIPVIHLVFRGLPPNIRPERYRPEYVALYRAMAEIPGVSFVSNSHAGAIEYAKWLGLPVERFRILYNGVPELSSSASDDDHRKWNEFATRTADASETIGGVFRLEPDKRPLLWIKLASRYLKRRPLARFVIVGDGRLHDNVVHLAADLGLTDRLLLVGLSSHIGFWYSKMDVKVLLSRHEGLPNVLIEAQMGGVCTVSTPAGGAGECFVDGETGYLLDCAENPDIDQACRKIETLVLNSQADSTIGHRSQRHAQALFSVQAMIDTFTGLCRPHAMTGFSPRRIDPQKTLEIA